MSYRVVWFKRDLRVNDHWPLLQAARHGPVLCLYVIEPLLWAQPDAAAQHYGFVRESLQALDAELRSRGNRLHVAVGDMVDVLSALYAAAPFEALHAHEETGNAFTFARDLSVGQWCRARGVSWHEWPQFGVVRRLRDRRQWQPQWEQHMAAAQALDPAVLPCPQLSDAPVQAWGRGPLPGPAELGMDPFEPPRRQRGGRARALQVLADFLDVRSASYRGGISSPLSAPDACSRLSPYLAHGVLSLREVVQATRAQVHSLPPEARRQRQGLQSFVSRLYWHCHFIQKLESEPELEWRNLHRGYDGLREADWNEAHFEALTQGRTGWPMVDACVAMLRETGWLNFRMRAMLVSVAAYPLWLHWQPVGHWLARQFLDYEPGIHWPQMQMQSGTTGINTTRVYNPVKQAIDHDPQGLFVRQWLPALRRVPDSWLFEPWRMSADVAARCGVCVGDDIAVPPVELMDALRDSKARMHALRRHPAVRAARADVVERHGSRRGMPGASRDARGEERPAAQRRPAVPKAQMTLDF
ncbi:MAG: deoxyribodipyrimidine photo-lyase/cryptochrome family protein [Limnohabitans sp.]